MRRHYWAALVAALKVHCPLSRPVRIYRRHGLKLDGLPVCGYCDQAPNGRSYRIFVDTAQSRQRQAETIAHEWAHLMDFDARGTPLDAHHDWHDCRWGVQYSKAYRVLEEWQA